MQSQRLSELVKPEEGGLANNYRKAILLHLDNNSPFMKISREVDAPILTMFSGYSSRFAALRFQNGIFIVYCAAFCS